MAQLPNQPCPDIAQAQVTMLSDNQYIMHSLYFYKATHWSAAEILGLATEVATGWATTIMPNYPDSVAVIRCVSTDLSSLAGARAVYELPIPGAGGITGPAAPNNVCWAMQLSTGSRGRGRQGRLFLGPLAADEITLDTLTGVRADAFVGDFTTLKNAIVAAIPGAVWSVLSRYEGTNRRPQGIHLPITAPTYTNLLVDSQKDRLPMHKKRSKKKTTTPPAP